MRSILHQVENRVLSKSLFKHGDTIVVAVSGGPDSVALFHMLSQLAKKYHWKLVAAHLNHQFRGEESEREAQGVAMLAQQLNWPVVIEQRDVPQYIQETGANLQAAARELRYEFLEHVAKENQARVVALAHHADDQAETFLMNVLRGAGLYGLKGIKAQRDWHQLSWVRPLLSFQKQKILQYCELHQIEFFTDSSNLTEKYLRNQIRLKLIPYLENYNPQLSQAINRTVDILSVEHDFIEQETERVFQEMVFIISEGYRFNREAFISLHEALQRRLITLILRYLSPEADVYDFQRVELIRVTILKETPPSGELHISDVIHFYREYNEIKLQKPLKKEKACLDFEYLIEKVPCLITIDEVSLNIEARLVSMQEVSLMPRLGTNEAIFDADHLLFPLTIRNRRHGDRIELQGLGGRKKIKDLFMDEKIPPSKRDRLPLLTNRFNQILWVAGIRRSIHAPVSDKTTRFLHISCSSDIL